MKKYVVMIIACLTMCFLCGCCASHEYNEATCTEPKTCAKCEKTKGEALGHTWEDATCTEPKTCSVCGETEEKALGHEWIEATCTTAQTCNVCGETKGNPLGHNWKIICNEPQMCSLCEKTKGEPVDHDWKDATAKEPKTCKNCGLTDGEALGYQYFSMDSYEFVDAYNRSTHALGKLDKDSNTMQIAGTNLEIIFFVWDVSESELPHAMYAIPEKDFNAMGVRFVSYGSSKYDLDSLTAVVLFGQSFAEILDPTYASKDFSANGTCSTSGNSFVITYSHNGFEYKLEGSPMRIGSSNSFVYDFWISLSANAIE